MPLFAGLLLGLLFRFADQTLGVSGILFGYLVLPGGLAVLFGLALRSAANGSARKHAPEPQAPASDESLAPGD